MTTDLCWCGGSKTHADCHSKIDAKIELYRKAGQEVPDQEMIKTPEQIAVFERLVRSIRQFWTK